MPDVVILYTTWPDAEKAEAVGAEAVEAGLAACVTVFAGVRSVYRWQGAVERAGEAPMTLKTTAEAAAALRDFILDRHPYDLPCVVGWPVSAPLSHGEYLEWAAEQVSPRPGGAPSKDSAP